MGFFSDWIAPVGGAVVGGLVGGPVGALAGASVGGAVSSASAQKDINQQNIDQANALFDKQKAETDTAHQREVEDLRLAGLNPILSAKYGGSASATGSMPQLSNPMEDVSQSLNSAGSLALNNNMTKAQIKTESTKQEVNSATASRERAMIGKVLADTRLTRAQAKILSAQAWSKGSWFGKVGTPIADILKTLNPLSAIGGK